MKKAIFSKIDTEKVVKTKAKYQKVSGQKSKLFKLLSIMMTLMPF